MMVEPPGEPMTAVRSGPMTMLGYIDDNMRLPGSGAFALLPSNP